MKSSRNGCLKHPQAPRVYGGCQECRRASARKWSKEHQERHLENSRRHHKDKKENVSERKKAYYTANPDKYLRQLEMSKQAGYRKWRGTSNYEPPHKGICPICTKEKLLIYDHCHKTGAFRGWICNNCNRGLGYFEDDSFGMFRALNYLVDFEASQPSAETQHK